MTRADDHRWIQTFTGRAFWPLDPRPEEVELADIAHALAMKCRFTGHTQSFYSVAQHSVEVMRLLERWHPGNRELALWGLLHDAPEAYLADVARPVKHELVGFQAIEDRLMEVIAARFGLAGDMPPEVKAADNALLAVERRCLMPNPPRPWRNMECDVPELTIVARPPMAAKAGYLAAARMCGLTLEGQ